ncbi:nucleotidyltransferase family protein [Rubritalea sp.]|uniref:nucleotidyltransferase family protein n=1 Tax=Rubritalea sp. TaxID=2109375 RepID=UPI003EF82F73
MITPNHTVRELMELIGLNARGIALVADNRTLITTLTDGDLRRGLLDGVKLEDNVLSLMQSKDLRGIHDPIVVSPDVSDDECIAIMRDNQITQLPVVDKSDYLLDIVFSEELMGRNTIRLSCLVDDSEAAPSCVETYAYGVIMAGGFGTRLRPLTDHMPKPMLPVNGRPLLEHIVERFKQSGIKDIYLSTYYKRRVIEEYFEDGSKFNVNIRYLQENEPNGTAGALSLVPSVDRPLVVTNGDILTKVGWRALLDFHHDHKASVTVGVRQYDMTVPYGVMRVSGEQVTSIEEKPVLDFLVNAGVYVVSEKAHGMIPKGVRYDMTDLIEEVIRSGGSVVAYPIAEYWIDIGQMADYEKAQKDHG